MLELSLSYLSQESKGENKKTFSDESLIEFYNLKKEFEGENIVAIPIEQDGTISIGIEKVKASTDMPIHSDNNLNNGSFHLYCDVSNKAIISSPSETLKKFMIKNRKIIMSYNHVINPVYLTHLFKHKLPLAFSINGHLSILNRLLLFRDQTDIVNDPFITKIMTDIHKLRPSSTKYQEIWDANQVFKHLSTIKVIPKYSYTALLNKTLVLSKMFGYARL
ncbi:hypothetical protein ACTFIR_003910 [Dictyostelium discoideum]